MQTNYNQKSFKRRRGQVFAAAIAAVATMSIGGLALAGSAPTASGDVSMSTAEVFVGMSPTRVLDTRQGGGTRFAPFETRTLNLSSAVPAEASSVVINTTLDAAVGPTYLTIWPTGNARPVASVNNAIEGVTMPNSMIAKLGTNHSLDIYNERNATQVIIDVVGYFVPADKVSGLGGGTVGPAGPVGATGAPGLDGQDGSGTGVVTDNSNLAGLPLAVLSTTSYIHVATFTAPVDGNFLLDASIDAQFDPSAPISLGAAADVVCRWDDGNNVERGASITADIEVALVVPITVPGLGYANIGVPGVGTAMTAGDTIDLQCKSRTLLAVGSRVEVSAAFTAVQVTALG